jgi:COP9 signalosome complex subunit 4
LKQAAAEVYAAKREFEKAARILEKINLETRKVTPDDKANIFVTIAEYWFEDDDAVNAEKFIFRAAHIIHLVKDQQLVLRYKVSNAKITDSKRQFLFASYAYFDLSNQEGVDADDLQQLLAMSMTCAILSPAGPKKSRIIGLIAKDDRSKSLDNIEIIEKMFKGKIIKKEDTKKFEEELQTH